MDQWVQKLSLAVLLAVVSLCLYGAANREITCHTPKHFTSDHSRHAHQACSKPEAITYLPFIDTIPRDAGKITWTSPTDTKSAWLLKLVLMEVIIICAAYCLIDWLVAAGRVDARSPHKELHQSYFKVPLYFLIQIVCGVCWVAFTIVSNEEKEWPAAPSLFMCEYEVRTLGNNHRYTIECIEHHDYFTRAAFMINFGLALVVTITKLIHVVSALLIGPFLGLKAARAALMQSGVIQNPWQLGVGFALSDLYFSMLTSGKGSPVHRPNVECNAAQGGRRKELALIADSE